MVSREKQCDFSIQGESVLDSQLGETLRHLGIDGLGLLVIIGGLALRWSPLILWITWWLWGVNWKKAWPVLTGGAWLALLLLVVLVALAWSQIAPSHYLLPNFYWQLV